MWVIKKARIKNFRSIVDGTFEPGSISIVVGENDVGKSNYIRALNLFFNGETELGRRFEFASDFSHTAIVGKGKARQVEITLYIDPPETFADRGVIVWRRYWREESPSFIAETFFRLPGNKAIALKSKAIQWLRGIKFRYVPAIKGADYFAALMRELHDTLAATIDTQLRAAAADFIGVVRNHTAGISQHLSEYLNLQSQLQLPENLRSLFEVLDFSTASGTSDISLRLRGDGIKVRHIPAVLKFLADQERRLSPVGKPRSTSIWGYEEPENNLEMKRAFEHADELYSSRGSAQIFLTTHSPAFYGMATSERSDEVRAFNALPDPISGTQLHKVDAANVGVFDASLGIMPLIAPYINAKVDELKNIDSELAALKYKMELATKPMVVVAGETDALYISSALQIFALDIFDKLEVMCIGRQGLKGSVGTGDPKLLALVEHWNNRHQLLSRPAIVILDCDVKNPPASINPGLTIYNLPLSKTNSVARRGIENLLPDSVFSDSFYSEKVENIEYGGSKVVRTLDKMKLCKAICSDDVSVGVSRNVALASFADLVGVIRSSAKL